MHTFTVTVEFQAYNPDTGMVTPDTKTHAVNADFYIPTKDITNFYIGAQTTENIVASYHNVVSVVRRMDSAEFSQHPLLVGKIERFYRQIAISQSEFDILPIELQEQMKSHPLFTIMSDEEMNLQLGKPAGLADVVKVTKKK